MALTNQEFETIKAIIAQELSKAASLQDATSGIAKGVTQYIGARYVPLFANPIQWDNTREYEPLTIVLYQGNSYTTRQYTPAGIDISNEAFWAETGNYNAQVEQYRQEVEQYKSEVDTFNDKLSKTNSIVEELTAQVNCFKNIETLGVLTTNTDAVNNDNLVKALKASADENFVIIVPDKTYNIIGNIAIPSNAKIIGINKCKSVLKFSGDTGFYTAADENGYECAHGVIIANLMLDGAYQFGPNNDSDETRFIKSAIRGEFFGSVLEKLFIRNWVCGIRITFPNFRDNDYNTYNAKYGDVRIISDVTLMQCYYGINVNSPDWYFEYFNIGRSWSRAFYIRLSNVVNNFHVWGFGGGNSLQNCRATNIEIESPEPSYAYNNNINYILQLVNEVNINNLVIWNIYGNDNEDTVHGAHIYCSGRTVVNANNIVIGRSEDTKLVNYAVHCDENASFNGNLTIAPSITSLDSLQGYPIQGNGVNICYTVNGFNKTASFKQKKTFALEDKTNA